MNLRMLSTIPAYLKMSTADALLHDLGLANSGGWKEDNADNIVSQQYEVLHSAQAFQDWQH